jgi:hypothetical protein
MALNDRKGGLVARIRVNPKDCLGILDVMEAMGLAPTQHSFSGCVAISLSSLIALARKQEVIPQEENGFQYLNRLSPFLNQQSTRVKRERTNLLYEKAQHGINGTPPLLPRKGDIIPIHEEFDREAGMKEYLDLKNKVMEGSLEATDARFLILQDKLF